MTGLIDSVPHAARPWGIVWRVRGGSRQAGRFERQFWHPTTRRQTRLIVLAAKRYELARRQRGCRSGPLGPVALEVLELMGNLVDFRSGRLEPSLVTLMRMLKRSRDAIVRALRNLRTHGFLTWMRRYASCGTAHKGPQVTQVANAYRLHLPHGAAPDRARRSPPPPDDWTVETAERERMRKTWLAALPREELPGVVLGSSALAESLARLALNIGQRESARRSESPS
jgi:hypothetical protein